MDPGLFIIDPDGVIQHCTTNNLLVARSVDETKRTLQAFQFNREHGAVSVPPTLGTRTCAAHCADLARASCVQVCPADWQPESGSAPKQPKAAPAATPGASAATSAAIDVASPDQFESAVASGTSIVMFHAGWCTKCKTVEPLFDELSVERSDVVRGVIVLELALHGLLAAAHKYCCFERQTFVKFDTARGTMQALADSLDLTALPSFRVFKNGQAVGKDVVGHKHQPLVDAVQAL